MGMQPYWALKHPCACCEYWDGERTIANRTDLVYCDGLSTGTCMGPHPKYRGHQIRPGTYTGNQCFKLWHCLSEH